MLLYPVDFSIHYMLYTLDNISAMAFVHSSLWNCVQHTALWDRIAIVLHTEALSYLSKARVCIAFLSSTPTSAVLGFSPTWWNSWGFCNKFYYVLLLVYIDRLWFVGSNGRYHQSLAYFQFHATFYSFCNYSFVHFLCHWHFASVLVHFPIFSHMSFEYIHIITNSKYCIVTISLKYFQ